MMATLPFDITVKLNQAHKIIKLLAWPNVRCLTDFQQNSEMDVTVGFRSSKLTSILRVLDNFGCLQRGISEP
jgi:hypothetical protein